MTQEETEAAAYARPYAAIRNEEYTTMNRFAVSVFTPLKTIPTTAV